MLLPIPRVAKIYIGIHDKRVKVRKRADKVVGISNPDEVISSTKDIARDCKPDIPIRTYKIPIDNAKKKAVVVIEVTRGKLEVIFMSTKKLLMNVWGTRAPLLAPLEEQR